jgi:hypothetical protein
MKTPPPIPNMAAIMPTKRERIGRKIISMIVVAFHQFFRLSKVAVTY